MLLKTGFGYYVKNGKKLHKFELKPGEHPDPVSYQVVEVENRDALDAITIDHSDEQIAQAQQVILTQKLKDSAKGKLKNVGLTDDEIKALVGV